MNPALKTQERREFGEARRLIILTPEQRDTLHEQLYLIGSIKEDVIKVQAAAAPILEVLTILEKHERRIKACF